MGNRVLLGLFVIAAICALLWVALSGGEPIDTDPDLAGPAARPDDVDAPPPVVPVDPVPDAPADLLDPDPVADGTGTLLVSVTDPDKHALAGAIVRADGRTQTTGADGVARFDDLPAGTTIRVEVEGPNPQDVLIGRTVVVRKDAEIETSFRIYAGGGVRGVVRGPEGAPLTAPFRITLEPTAVVGASEGRLNEVTVNRDFPAGDGSFTFPRIRLGSYVATARAKGFVEGQSKPFWIKPGQVAEGIEITLTAAGSVSGVVVDRATGEPVTGAMVCLGENNHVVYMASGSDIHVPGEHSAAASDRGEFRIENVAPGTYRLTAAAGGRPPETIKDVEVVAGAETGGLRLALDRGGTITGTVFGPDGSPEAGKSVLVQLVIDTVSFEGDYGRKVKTDAKGVYRAEGLEPGRYRVKLPADDRMAEIGIAFSGMGMDGEEEKTPEAPLDPDMVEVKEGQVVTKDLRAEPRGRVQGTVKTRDGKPLEEMVRLNRVRQKKKNAARPAIEIPRMEHPNSKGAYAFEGLESGTWRVSCGDRSKTIEVGPGDTVEVPFVLSPASVAGIVVDEAGRPVKGAEVHASRSQRLEDGPFAGGHVYPVRTGADGRFTFPRVFSGTWTIRATKDGADGNSKPVEVSEGASIRDLRIEMVTLTELRVRVLDTEGKPRRGAWVAVSSQKTGESRHGQTNAAGVAVVNVRGGTEYLVVAWGEGAVQSDEKVKVDPGVPAEIEIKLK